VVAPNPKSFADEIDRRMGDAVDVDGTDVTAPSGEKLFDILEAGQFDPEQRGRFGSGTGQEGDTIAFGLREEDPVFTDEGVETTTLSDQTARKLQGALKETGATEREVGGVSGAVTPRNAGRVKDIPDFFIGERANIAKLELQGDDARAARAREELDRFLDAFDDDIEQRARREFRQAADDGIETTFTAKADDGADAPTDAPASSTVGVTAAGRADAEASPLSSSPSPASDSTTLPLDGDSSPSPAGGGSSPSPVAPSGSSAPGFESDPSTPGFGSDSPSTGFGSDSPSPGSGSGSPSPGFGSGSPSPGLGSDSPSPTTSPSPSPGPATETSLTSSLAPGPSDPTPGNRTPRLPDFDDDDDAFALGPDDDGDESPFTNPVEPAEEVFDRPESGGRTGNIGEDGPLSAPFSEGGR